MRLFHFGVYLALLIIFGACKSKEQQKTFPAENRVVVEMLTEFGSIYIALYDETPQHRDNFVKLVNEGAYDSLLFHRVIKEFMIQGGDPDSRYAQVNDTLGSGGLSYKIDAEFNPALFHKKGALAAARTNNPERASSSMQFYLVQGQVQDDASLDNAEVRINNWLAEHYVKNDSANKSVLEMLQKAMDEEDMQSYILYGDSIRNMAKNYTAFERYVIPVEQRNVYKTIGGTPHLDQNYTVFGEVIEGIEIIDSIAAAPTGLFDRPLSDIRIQTIHVVAE